jgi:hypothetical protein
MKRLLICAISLKACLGCRTAGVNAGVGGYVNTKKSALAYQLPFNERQVGRVVPGAFTPGEVRAYDGFSAALAETLGLTQKFFLTVGGGAGGVSAGQAAGRRAASR